MEKNEIVELTEETAQAVPSEGRKPVEEMSERELLMELVTEKRRQEKRRYVWYTVLCVIVIGLIVLAAVCVPKVITAYDQMMDTYDKVEEVYGRANEIASQAEETMDNINDTLINRLNPAIDSYNTLRDSAAEKLQEASEVIGNITEALRNLFTFR